MKTSMSESELSMVDVKVMVANAGVILVKPILEISASEWDKVQAVSCQTGNSAVHILT